MALVRKLRCKVRQIVNHGCGVYSLALDPEERLPVWRPGQFLHLALDEYDPSGFWPDSRPFSIANSTAKDSGLRISFAVKGQFTTRMERELVEGRQVWIKLPYGEFVVDGGSPAVLIAGGTGITAFSAFIEALKPGQAHDIHLFYGARSVDLLIYREVVARIALSVPCFSPEYFVEAPPGEAALSSGFRPRPGRLNIEIIWSLLAHPLDAAYYLSGPPAMLNAFSNELQARGVPQRQIRIDAWE
jgi:ferredoxin-NADP reductase